MTSNLPSPIDSHGRIVLFHEAVGRSVDDCSAIVRRLPAEDATPDDVDSWVVTASPSGDGRVTERIEQGRNDRYPTLWRSPSGDLYVPENMKHVLVREARNGTWKRVPLPNVVGLVVAGIGGTQDGSVFLWGIRGMDESGIQTSFFRYDGGRFEELPTPGLIFRLQGTDRNNVIAVGASGLASRWDGQKWRSLQLDTPNSMSALDLVSKDEIYIASQGGELFLVTGHGSTRMLTSNQTFLAVARFGEHIYLATAGDNGLYRVPVNGGELEQVSADLYASSLERGPGRLFLTCADALVEFDGQDFRQRPIDHVYDILSDTPALRAGMPPLSVPPPKVPAP